MSCFKCTDKFGLFKKEIGCANCGYGFCSKCCNQKIIVPKRDNKKLVVCFDCFEILNGTKNNKRDISPPENFKKLVEINSKKTSITNNEEKELSDRLARLGESKSKDKTVVLSQDEIEKRLHNLMGVNATPKSNLPTKSVVNNPEDLIKKYNEEVRIDENLREYNQSELEKLEQRLKKLSDSPVVNNEVVVQPKLDPTKVLMNKFLNEAQVKYNSELLSDDESEEKERVCCICDKTPSLKCLDCDSDFYCKNCFKQGHNTQIMKKHQVVQLS